MNSRKIMTGLAVLLLSVSAASLAQAAKDQLNSKMTKDFITTASAAGMFEIDSSKVALEKSSNDKVKEFAQHMIDDHTKASKELEAALSEDQKQYMSGKETHDQQNALDKLNKDEAKGFDKDYVKVQVKAHEEAVSLFKKYSEKGDDAKLKDFAANTLPILQQHKTMIDDINSSMK